MYFESYTVNIFTQCGLGVWKYQSFSERVLKYVTASQVTASFHWLPIYHLGQNVLFKQSRPGDIDDGK